MSIPPTPIRYPRITGCVQGVGYRGGLAQQDSESEPHIPSVKWS